MSKPGIYHHAKTNTDYAVLCVGKDSTNATNDRRLTIYTSLKDERSRTAVAMAMAAINYLLSVSPESIYVREETEFDSPGRFVSQDAIRQS